MICPNCAHDLRGQSRNESNVFRCPECGAMSIGTASRSEVTAAYRSLTGALGREFHVLGARYLSSPAILRTVRRRLLWLCVAVLAVPVAATSVSMVIRVKHYDHWWYSPDAPEVRMDLDHITSRQPIIGDPNSGRPRYVWLDYKCPDGRAFTGQQTHETLWLGLPSVEVFLRSIEIIVWSSAVVAIELAWVLIVSRVLIGLSPLALMQKRFAIAVGMAGYVIVPMTLTVCMLLPLFAAYLVSNHFGIVLPILLAAAVLVPTTLWIGYITALLPKLVLTQRERGRRTFCGAIILCMQLILPIVALLLLM